MKYPVFSIQWHITTKCEQKCRHCYIFNSPEGKKEIEGESKISFSKLKLIADNLVVSCERLGARPRVSLTGGNPLLHSYFWQLLEYLKSLGVKVGILGNPFGITDDVAQRLKNLNISNFQLSLDGMESFHDKQRRLGSFSETEEACKILKRNGIKVTIMSTVSKENMHEIPRVAEHVVKMGVSSYAFARYCPTHGDVDCMFSSSEYREFLNVMWDVYSRYVDSKTNFILKDHLWSLFLTEKDLFQPETTNNIIVSGCGLGIAHLSVLADGTVFACRRFNSPVGKVPGESLYKIFFNKKMGTYRNFSLLKKCVNCNLLPYCRGCAAVTHGSTGNWTEADPQCWK